MGGWYSAESMQDALKIDFFNNADEHKKKKVIDNNLSCMECDNIYSKISYLYFMKLKHCSTK